MTTTTSGGNGGTLGTGTKAAESEHQTIKGMLGRLGETTDFATIRDIVDALARLLPEHFEREEGADGLYEELLLMQPGLAPKIDRLVRDHQGLRGELDELQGVIGQLESLHRRLCTLKDGFITHLIEHEAVESGLVADAYYIDLGDPG